VYQGEELGLPEVEDLPPEVRQDPAWERSGHTDPGRDGCRVPVPWSGSASPFGFSPEGSVAPPWLPQPTWFASYTAALEDDDPDSMLALYRKVLAVRRSTAALGDGGLAWLPSADHVLAFRRPPGVLCVVNFSAAPVALPAHREVLLASTPLVDGMLAGDAAVWLSE
jgi:alpha-glucosidase